MMDFESVENTENTNYSLEGGHVRTSWICNRFLTVGLTTENVSFGAVSVAK